MRRFFEHPQLMFELRDKKSTQSYAQYLCLSGPKYEMSQSLIIVTVKK